MQPSYELNEIVWAKVIGYPWWPATVSRLAYSRLVAEWNHSCLDKTLISTSCTSLARTHSASCQIASKKLAKYTPNCEQFKQSSQTDRRLRQSILAAERIIAGLTDVETELAKLRAKSKTVNKKAGKKKSTPNGKQPTGLELEPEVMKSDTTSLAEPPSALLASPAVDGLAPITSQPWDPSDVEQELQTLQLHEGNIIQLLEEGLARRLKCLPEEKAARHRRVLKKILLRKYFRKADEGLRRRPIVEPRPRTKIIQKPQQRKQELNVRTPKETQRLCVLKLYSLLKQSNVERNEAKVLSVQAVKRLQEDAEVTSRRFMAAYGSLVYWIRVHYFIMQDHSTSLDIGEQLLARISERTQDEEISISDCKTKNCCETSSSVF